LLNYASELETADTELKAILSPEMITSIVNLIPDDWLTSEWEESPDEVRAVYAQFLNTRIASSQIFVNEAQHAREILI